MDWIVTDTRGKSIHSPQHFAQNNEKKKNNTMNNCAKFVSLVKCVCIFIHVVQFPRLICYRLVYKDATQRIVCLNEIIHQFVLLRKTHENSKLTLTKLEISIR